MCILLLGKALAVGTIPLVSVLGKEKEVACVVGA